MNQFVKRYRLYILGEPSSGKTCLTECFVNGKCPSETVPSEAHRYMERILKTTTEKSVKLMIWDTAGCTRQKRDTFTFCTRPDAFILMYNPTIKESFFFLLQILNELPSVSKSTPKFLIGNKEDVIEEHPDLELIRKSEAVEFAEKYGMKFYTLNARNVNQVSEVMQKIIDEIHGSSEAPIDWKATDVADSLKRTDSTNKQSSCLGTCCPRWFQKKKKE